MFLLAGGGGGYNFNFPLTLPPNPFGLFVFSRRGGGGGGVVVEEVGGVGSKMYKNLAPPISTHTFPRSIQKHLLFNLSCLTTNQNLYQILITSSDWYDSYSGTEGMKKAFCLILGWFSSIKTFFITLRPTDYS